MPQSIKFTPVNGDRDVDGLLSGVQWAGRTLSYSIPTSRSQYGSDDPDAADNFKALNAAQSAAVKAVLAEISSFTGLTFTFASGGAGTLRFGNSDAPGDSAYAYFPSLYQWGGDVWLGNGLFSTPARGNYEYMAFLHETGHALGLKHPHEEGERMTLSGDAMERTVMSYRSYAGQEIVGYTNGDWSFAQTFMMQDIAALQHMYGANFSHNSGNTRYSWNPDTGAFAINGKVQWGLPENKVFMTLWDGGGTDTFDFSKYAWEISINLEPGFGTWLPGQQADLGDGRVAGASIYNALLYQDDKRSLIENAIGGSADDSLTGNVASNRLEGGAGSDSLAGRAGNDVLIGGAGADRMTGEDGGDLYYVDDPDDQVFEFGVGGVDTISASISYGLADDVERLVLTGTAADGSGNGSDNELIGNSGANRLTGGDGNDVLRGAAGSDTLEGNEGQDIASYAGASGGVTVTLTLTGRQNTGGAGNDALVSIEGLIGSSHSDRLTGSALADFLDGGSGADTLTGGKGNDSYVVDNAGDVVKELAGEGRDTVESSVAFSLVGLSVEALVLTGTAAIAGTGNALANSITGNAAANVLNGDAGADTMWGGAGDDIYVVDGPDIVFEAAAEGTDTIRSSATFWLDVNIENLSLTGAAAINGIGNIQRNVITGNSAGNVLDGREGADSLAGGGGNDRYVVDNIGDTVKELAGEGVDTVDTAISLVLGANLEKLRLTGAAVSATGNQLANQLTGNALANVLDGAAGADRMEGGDGDDLYIVDNAADAVTEAWNRGSDTVRSSVAYVLPEEVESLILTGSAAIDGRGNALANSLIGNAAANRLNGGQSADSMAGGKGDDTYVVDSSLDTVKELADAGTDTVEARITYTLGANVERLRLVGTNSISGTGNRLANSLTGNGAGNVLDGGAGADQMAGGAGDDAYVVDDVGDVVTERADAGYDSVLTAISFAAGANVELLELTGTAAANLTGNELANVLTGNEAANVLNGGAGADDMRGGEGDDTYLVDNSRDLTSDSAGIDTVRSTMSYRLGNGIEHLVLAGGSAINGYGNELANRLTGNAAANLLDGGAGADVMAGGAGNDIYVLDDRWDVVRERSGEGTDTVRVGFSFTLGDNLENLILTGASAWYAGGNALANRITGNGFGNLIDGAAGADLMAGGDGDDIYVVDQAADVVLEAIDAGRDTIHASVSYRLASGQQIEDLTLTGSAPINATGNELANALTGNAAANVLNGAAGADWMAGQGGNDLYMVDHRSDMVYETAGQGIDTVTSSVSFILHANVEHLILTGTGAISAHGNELANRLTGNAAANWLNGSGGADTLEGGAGNDNYFVDTPDDRIIEAAGAGVDTVYASVSFSLVGHSLENLILNGNAAINGTGNGAANAITGNIAANRLDGGAGADRLEGDDGADVYFVDNAGDVVIDETQGDFDTVNSSVSFVLPYGVDSLVLIGSAAIDGTGNDYPNMLTGNSAANRLDGGVGPDTMAGGAGDDIYVVDYGVDKVIEAAGGGNDTVRSSVTLTLSAEVENLVLTGAGDTAGTGNALANAITGNRGANWLNGGAGADRLTGGAGADRFYFNSALDPASPDRIVDFKAADDEILLACSVFTGLAYGTLAQAAFCAGTAALDADDRVIWDSAAGKIYFDSDGNGGAAQILFVQVAAGTILTNADFIGY